MGVGHIRCNSVVVGLLNSQLELAHTRFSFQQHPLYLGLIESAISRGVSKLVSGLGKIEGLSGYGVIYGHVLVHLKTSYARSTLVC